MSFSAIRIRSATSTPAVFGRLTSPASGLAVKVGTADRSLTEGEATLTGYNGGEQPVMTASTKTVTHQAAGTVLSGNTANNAATIIYFEARLPNQSGGTQCQDLPVDDLVITKAGHRSAGDRA